MAGAGYKLFNTGDVLTAAQVNTYLQEQAVMRFADATARTTALSGVLAEGMMSYLDDTNSVEVYNGSAWVSVGSTGDITGVTAGTGISGGGTSGTVTITNDMATTITAAGDIVVGTGSGTYDNLPIGTTGQVLTADTTVSPYKVKWASASSSPTFTGCSLYDAVNKSIANATFTVLTFPSEQFDTNGFHSTTTNTSRITIPTGLGGYYLVSGNLRFAANGTGSRVLMLRKNGSDLLTITEYAGTAAATETGRGTLIYNFVAGDYLEILAYQSSGGNLTLYAREEETPFQVQFLGA